MTAMNYYLAECDKHHYRRSPAQLAAADVLSSIQREISQPGEHRHWFSRHEREQIKGLYLWGEVGRGKTFLMDCFYEALPFSDKQRMHYHRFMQSIHVGLQKYQGTKEPLKHIIKQLALTTRVLCLDEFFVDDIGDAMILAGVFEQLFAESVVLVTTSNIAPQQLYMDGLQRQRFLPTIDLIEKYMRVLEIAGDEDYRLAKGQQYANYYFPNTVSSWHSIEHRFVEEAVGQIQREGTIELLGRALPCRLQSDNSICFDFSALCETARSQYDYIELARRFDHLYLCDVPQLGADNGDRRVARGTEDAPLMDHMGSEKIKVHSVGDDVCRGFISLIDECYDQRMQVVISAAVTIPALYRGGAFRGPFRANREPSN